MATQQVTINVDDIKTPPTFSVSPNPVMVNGGDTIVWSLGANINWPSNSPSDVMFDSKQGSVNLLSSVIYVPPANSGAGTMQGTVIANAIADTVEHYTLKLTVLIGGDEGDVVISADDPYYVDPKIKINPPPPLP